jgi:hypothetical protein
MRGLFAWLRQWVYWDEYPTPEAFREACQQRDAALAKCRKLEVQLAVARADSDAANAEVETLALVCQRNRERVEAEAAQAAADRERSLMEASGIKNSRRA